MDAAAVVSTLTKVVSGLFRWKVTVASSGVSMAPAFMPGLFSSPLPMEASRTDAPFGSAILRLRSKLNFTSEEVREWPLENFSPGRSLQVRVFESE